jgi:prepilin peptidase CpaA
MSVTVWLSMGACLAASYFDIRARRIPNWLTGSVVAAALIVHGFSGIRALGVSVAVMAVLVLLGTCVYSRGGIGGGDVKLAIAASGLLSFPLCVPFLLYTMLGGGVLAIAFLLRRGNARQSFSRVVAMTAGVSPSVTSVNSQTLPYAVAFAFGSIVIALSQTVAPFLRIVL